MSYHYKAVVLVPIELETITANKLGTQQARELFRTKAIAKFPQLTTEDTCIQSIEGDLYVEPGTRATRK